MGRKFYWIVLGLAERPSINSYRKNITAKNITKITENEKNVK